MVLWSRGRRSGLGLGLAAKLDLLQNQRVGSWSESWEGRHAAPLFSRKMIQQPLALGFHLPPTLPCTPVQTVLLITNSAIVCKLQGTEPHASSPASFHSPPIVSQFLIMRKASSLKTFFDEIEETNGDDECRAWSDRIFDSKFELVTFVASPRGGVVAREYVGFLKGSFNFSFRLRFSDGGPDDIIRFLKPGHTATAPRDEKVANEVQIMEYFSRNTTIPLPRVHSCGLTAESPQQSGRFIYPEEADRKRSGGHGAKPEHRQRNVRQGLPSNRRFQASIFSTYVLPHRNCLERSRCKTMVHNRKTANIHHE